MAWHLWMLWQQFTAELASVEASGISGADLATMDNARNAAVMVSLNTFGGLGAVVVVCTIGLLAAGILYQSVHPYAPVARQAPRRQPQIQER